MNLFSSSSSSSASSNPKFPLFSSTQNPPIPSKFHFPIPFKPIISSPPNLHFPPLSAHDSPSPSPSPPLQENPFSPESSIEENDKLTQEIRATKQSLEELLVVRRPVMESSDEDERFSSLPPSPIDASLSKFAKKMPYFEPERVESSSRERRPLIVNLDLALYKAKVLARNFRYQEAENLLQKCIYYWSEDGRSYVALGKILGKQSKANEARAVYEKVARQHKGKIPTFGSAGLFWKTRWEI